MFIWPQRFLHYVNCQQALGLAGYGAAGDHVVDVEAVAEGVFLGERLVAEAGGADEVEAFRAFLDSVSAEDFEDEDPSQ